MKKIYEAGGILNKGFIGQISYSICLDQEYEAMDLCFSFDKEKQRYLMDEITDKVIQEFQYSCTKNKIKLRDMTNDALISEIQGNSKTEIHTIATMNDIFIGGIHRQLSERHMTFSREHASEGCMPTATINGVIKLTLVVFNVIKDDTHYTVSLSVE